MVSVNLVTRRFFFFLSSTLFIIYIAMDYSDTIILLRVLQLLVYVLSMEYEREKRAGKTTTMLPRFRYTTDPLRDGSAFVDLFPPRNVF